MKIRSLVTVLALACGTAFAAQPTTSAEADAANANQSTAASSNAQPRKGGGVVDKTKNAMRRLGDKMRHATNRNDKNKTQTAARSDTRSMGAASSDADSARQQRMDDAYANWKSKQK
jgi:Skp family chaperone for outer membrane proteins